MEHKLLVVVDMQNDFVSGSLGSIEAQRIVDNVCDKIRNWTGAVCYTHDTHDMDYMDTLEGKKLPVPHCIEHCWGWQLCPEVERLRSDASEAFKSLNIKKNTFGSYALADMAKALEFDSIELVGLCTDICVISNAILLRAALPNTPIVVDASCCAGVTPETHLHALSVMKRCQIDIINERGMEHADLSEQSTSLDSGKIS